MKKNDDSNSNAHPALRSLRDLDLDASPYLAARVQANLKSQTAEKKSRGLASWFWPAVASAVTASLVTVLLTTKVLPSTSSASVAEYKIGQPYMIRVDIRALGENEIAYAEIELKDDNIEFASGKFSDVRTMKKLVVSWEQMMDKQYLPIVVQGLRSGRSQVHVSFFDKNDKLITSKDTTLSFTGKSI
jgi:hypothetical protein